MIQNTTISSIQDSPKTLKGCLNALVTVSAVVIFVLLTWLGKERTEALMAQSRLREAEQEAAVAIHERDTLRWTQGEALRNLREQLSKAEAGRQAAEREAQVARANAARLGGTVPTADVPYGTKSQPSVSAAIPSASDLMAFVQAHLARMAGPVEAQLTDYAPEDVDFHDKPHASLRAIENDRRQWAQKFPVREISLRQDVRPSLNLLRKENGGWIATASFNWQWQYKAKTGAVMSGVTRDTWKIAPSPQGLKIIAEHSADPITGQARD